jgi:hypothetical protein
VALLMWLGLRRRRLGSTGDACRCRCRCASIRRCSRFLIRFYSPLFPLFDAAIRLCSRFLMRFYSPLFPLFDALLFVGVPAFFKRFYSPLVAFTRFCFHCNVPISLGQVGVHLFRWR